MDRKAFITILGYSGLSMAIPSTQLFGKNKNKPPFFTLGKSKDRFFLVTPDNQKFFSIGLNHIDSATLRYQENDQLWDEKYANSMEKWLKQVGKELLRWNFNSVGWIQDVVVKTDTMRRHSENFSYEEYQWLNIPYCHMLPFADFHQWEIETRNPDFFSSGFEDWCDYVARDHCGRLKDDPKLIGYFYLDCPTWVHTVFESTVKKSIFDPEMLKSEAGRKEIYTTATQYYKTTFEAIKRYDKNHLILGDRYEAGKLIAEEVVQAAVPYIDVLSFQHFASSDKIVANLKYWYEKTGLPTLLADFAHNQMKKDGYLKQNTEEYGKTIQLLKKEPSCIGSHLCAPYIANRVRKKGFLDEQEHLDYDQIKAISFVNLELKKWMENEL